LLAETVDDARTFAVLHGLAMVYWNKAQFSSALQVAEEMLVRAERQHSRLSRLVAHRVMAATMNPMGQFDGARKHAASAVSLYLPEEDRNSAHSFGHDMGVGSYCHLAIAQTFLGLVAEARANGIKATDLARSLNNANTLLYNSLWLSFMSVVRQDWTQAHETTIAMVDEAEKRSMALWAVFGRYFLGCSLMGLGEPEAGLAELYRGRSDAAKLENRVFLPMTLSFEAQGLAALGRHDEAVTKLTEALRVIEETEEHWWEAEVHRTQGEIMLTSGSAPADCELKFRKAMEIAARQGAQLLQRRANASLESLRGVQAKQGRVA
jgi:predicted ATPase